MLLTGTGCLVAPSRAGRGRRRGELSGHALWWPPGKIAGRWLSPYLAEREDAAAAKPPRGTPLEIRLSQSAPPDEEPAVHVIDVLALEQLPQPGGVP